MPCEWFGVYSVLIRPSIHRKQGRGRMETFQIRLFSVGGGGKEESRGIRLFPNLAKRNATVC